MESTMLKKKMAAVFAAPENEDLLRNILTRLPAVHFASAACVSRSWNKVCNRILSCPKLATALSLSLSLPDAVQEIMDKVLSEPIRPHFAIACIGFHYNLAATQQLLCVKITGKLGSKIPIITTIADGLIGMDARTGAIREAKWELLEEEVPRFGGGLVNHINYCGIVLIIGYVPGLKVETIPLLRSIKDGTSVKKPRAPKRAMIDKFLLDIQEYTSSISNCTSPEAIIIFGNHGVDLKPILVQMDHNMPNGTVAVGDAGGCFIYQSAKNRRKNLYSLDAVALVFARDKSSKVGGKIEFHVTLSNGLLPFGPRLKVASVNVKQEEDRSRLTARIEGRSEIRDTRGLLQDVRARSPGENPSFYIGVSHKEERSARSRQLGSRPYMAFYEVLRQAGDWRFLVDGVGIKPSDSFLFYHTDTHTAFSTMIDAYEDLKLLKTNCDRSGEEVIGGLIFSGCSRQYSFPIVENLPFYSNYPGTPLAGLFCSREIARATASLDEDGEKEEDSNSEACFLHHYSTVYLVMSYTPYLNGVYLRCIPVSICVEILNKKK